MASNTYSNTRTSDSPLSKDHVDPGLLGEPMSKDFPLLVWIGEAEVVRVHQLWNELDDLHHGDIPANADTGPSSELMAWVSSGNRVARFSAKEDTYSHVASLHLSDTLLAVKPSFRSE